MLRRVAPAVATLLFAVGSVEVARGLWIPAKAELAQALLQRAWRQTRDGRVEARPWPWADTWPVARLRFPDRGADLVVLAGASGATMAFAPGHLDGSARPGGDGICVIAGHRDTHFAVLRDLAVGERVVVEDPAGTSHEYVVLSSGVVHESETAALGRAGPGSLALVTCWPFDGLRSGGDERYVVWAEPGGSPPATSCPEMKPRAGGGRRLRAPASSCATS